MLAFIRNIRSRGICNPARCREFLQVSAEFRMLNSERLEFVKQRIDDDRLKDKDAEDYW